MKHCLLYMVIMLFSAGCLAQQEFHVFPKNHETTPGTASGDGSITSPWDLQTALTQPESVVNGGDTIWLHKGIYNGRYTSTLKSTVKNAFVTVAAYHNDKVVLNGNIKSGKTSVLEVRGKQVIYKNFEITFLGSYIRHEKEAGFQKVDGLNHLSGKNCKFINLTIHDNPGSGIGSWKHTGGSVIEGCTIFNNGYIGKRGHGVGIYVQNASNQMRMITNNTIFNNYYKGIQIWSASKNVKKPFIKNVTVKNNVIFNSGGPSGIIKDNIIVASNDSSGSNPAQNILLLNNILYHNTDIANKQISGNAASLTLGFNAKAPIVNVTVKDNVIIGRNNALRFNNAKNLKFHNNVVYSGYVYFNKSVLGNFDSWDFEHNTYYTKGSKAIRVIDHEDYALSKWQSQHNQDVGSRWKHVEAFQLKGTLDISEVPESKNTYRIVLFNKEGKDVVVDFSGFNIRKGSTYTITDIENPGATVASGIVKGNKVTFPMQLTEFRKPQHNSKAQKTHTNFGVYTITFDGRRAGFFQRLFKWLF